MKTYKYKDSVSVGELIRIEGQKGIFEVIEKGGCFPCFFYDLDRCEDQPQCSPINNEPSKQFHKLEFPENSIGWWYEQLPEPLQSEAFDAVYYRFKNDTAKTKSRLFEKQPVIEMSIKAGFDWLMSERGLQGLSYWKGIYDSLKNNSLQKANEPTPEITPEPKQPRKRSSRAFKVTEPIKAGTQVSPTYRLVKQVESIEELATVFENHKSVYNQRYGKIQNTAFMRGMGFSIIFNLCKEGKIWIVEPVTNEPKIETVETQEEPEATGIDTAKDLVSVVVVFGYSILFLVLFFQTGAAIFKHEPFFFKLVGSIISLSIALYGRRKLKLNI